MHYVAWAQTGEHGERLDPGRAQHIKQEFIPRCFERPELRVRQRSQLPPVQHNPDETMIKDFQSGGQDADCLLGFLSKEPLSAEPPHRGEFRDMDAWREPTTGPRQDLQQARQLMLKSRQSVLDVTPEQCATHVTALMHGGSRRGSRVAFGRQGCNRSQSRIVAVHGRR